MSPVITPKTPHAMAQALRFELAEAEELLEAARSVDALESSEFTRRMVRRFEKRIADTKAELLEVVS